MTAVLFEGCNVCCSLAYTIDSQALFVSLSDGTIIMWHTDLPSSSANAALFMPVLQHRSSQQHWPYIFFCSEAALSMLLLQLQLIVLVRAAPSLCHSTAPAGCSSTRSLPSYLLCETTYTYQFFAIILVPWHCLQRGPVYTGLRASRLMLLLPSRQSARDTRANPFSGVAMLQHSNAILIVSVMYRPLLYRNIWQ